MRTLRAWILRFADIFTRKQGELDLSEEIESNLRLHIDDNIRAGMTPVEARRSALVRFGSIEAAKEAWRDRKRIPFLEVLMRDTRYTFRSLRKSPVFAITVILVLALGIGGNVAIFSIVNAALIRPLPYEAPDRLTLLWGNVQRTNVERRGASIPDYKDWSTNRSFEGLAGFWGGTFGIVEADERRVIPAEIVGAKYFSLLGVRPSQGREFTPEEENRFDSSPVVIVGHTFWTDHLGSDPSVLGKPLKLDAQVFTIVGVMPRGFRGLTDRAELWTPPGVLSGAQQLAENRGSRWFAALGRLRDGVTRQQAQAEMDTISKGLQETYPATNDKRAVEVASLVDETFGAVRPALLALLGAVGLVLLIACANVANLLLVRTETRHSEIAIRTALGASRRDVLQLVLTESLLLSFIGAAVGLFLARWGVQLILTASPIQLPSFVNINMDTEVLLFAVVLAVVTGILMGLVPALHAAPSNLSDTLKNSSSKSTGAQARQRFRAVLVVGEVALTFVLLVGAGLFIESFRQLSRLDPGFKTANLLTAQVELPRESSSNPQLLREALAALPGVESVALASDVPFAGANAIFYTAEGQPNVDATNIPRAYIHRSTPGYFRTMGMSLVHGRDFQEGEAATSVIVSESVIKRFWPGEDAIGKRIKSGRVDSTQPWLTIVGVAAETKTRNLPRNPTEDPDLFLPYSNGLRGMAVLIRTSVDPASLISVVRNEVRHVDKLALVSNLSTMEELMEPLTARSRFTSWLTGIFSAVALLLALVGVYGTMSYTVTQRQREIGIRMALGASKAAVFRTVLGRSLMLIGVGLVVGVSVGVAATRAISDLLFGVSATEPSVFFLVAVVLMTTGVLAAYVPARRALRIDPMRALREE